MATTAPLSTLRSQASDEATETFIINDISVGIAPADIRLYDDNYVFEQSFLRSNSVHCFRSKYSDTKAVLTFPFLIKNLVKAQGDYADNSTLNCINLITQLNSYPFCFIKNSRLRTYIAPMTISSTGFLMFAVEELAVIQSAAASNLVFVEVTLRYYNHSPLASDFKFVSNHVLSVGVTDKEIKGFEQQVLQHHTPVICSSLESSTVWNTYMQPKVTRAFDRLETVGLVKDEPEDDSYVHPGLDVRVFTPLVFSHAENSTILAQNDSDGVLVGPESKVIVTTNLEPMDNDSFETILETYAKQDFSEEEEEPKKEPKKGEKEVEPRFIPENPSEQDSDSSIMIRNPFFEGNHLDATEAEKIKAFNKKSNSGREELFINYHPINLTQLGVAVSKVEVRRSNNLASLKIGSYKHPVIQYLGKNPARTTIHYTMNNSGIYEEELTGMNAFLTHCFSVLDDNRLRYPAAEAYNHLKVHSLATLLLEAEDCLPNQKIVSASGDIAGVENSVQSYTETNIDKFVDQLKVQASGNKDSKNLTDGVEDIIKSWINSFTTGLVSEGYTAELLNNNNPTHKETWEIFRKYLALAKQALLEMGFASDTAEGVVIGSAIKTFTEDSKFTQYMIEGDVNKSLYHFSRYDPKYLLDSDSGLSPLYVLTSDIDKDKAVSSIIGSSRFVKMYKRSAIDHLYYISSLVNTIIMDRYNVEKGLKTSMRSVIYNNGTAFNGLAKVLASSLYYNQSEGVAKNIITDERSAILSELGNSFKGVLYGQNIEDLALEDVSTENYDPQSDILVQATDPFFFLQAEPILGTEMEEFYAGQFGVDELNPLGNIKQDAAEEERVEQGAGLLDVVYRDIKEVDFNAESYQYVDHVNLKNGASYTSDSVLPMSVQTAINKALRDFGLENDLEFVKYMQKTAQIESSGGRSLGTPGSEKGAKGLFQFLIPAISAVMSSNNTIFSAERNLPKAQADAAARKLFLSHSFPSDHYLNARLFISYYLQQGGKAYHPKTGKFDPALTFSKHNLGKGGYNNIMNYLTTGSNKITTNEAHYQSNGATGPVTWYKRYTESYSTMVIPGAIATSKTPADVKSSAAPSYLLNNKSNAKVTSTPISSLNKGAKISATVKNVVDGDTIDIVYISNAGTIQQRIRLAGVNTDETKVEGKDGNQTLWGIEAGEYLSDKILGKQVLVEFVDVGTEGGGVQGMKRLVGYVRINDQDVGLDLVSKGYTIPSSFSTQPQYSTAMAKAQREKIGRWSGLTPEEYKKKTQNQPTSKETPKLSAINVADLNVRGTTVFTNNQPFEGGKTYPISSHWRPSHRPKHGGLDIASPTGTKVIAIADGRAAVKFQAGGAGLYVEILHTGGEWTTQYMHLETAAKPEGTSWDVKQGDFIGKSGGYPGLRNSGSSRGVHLHYEVMYKGKDINPLRMKHSIQEYISGKATSEGMTAINQGAVSGGDYQSLNPRADRPGITKENTVYNKELLAQMILKNARDGVNTGLKTSLPAIKAYVIIGGENDGLGLDTLTSNGAQYYELKGISNFTMYCNNDSTPVDTAIMDVIDPSFGNTDGWTSISQFTNIDLDNIGSDLETTFRHSRLLLKPGTKLSIRLGYGNNPNDLTTVFNGGITEISPTNSQNLRLVLEGYGKELLQEIFHADEPKTFGDQNSPTTMVLGRGLNSKAIDHFGYVNNYIKNLYNAENDPEARNMVETFNSHDNWFFTTSSLVLRSRLYMNIFAPEIEMVDDEFAKYWGNFFQSLGVSNHQFGYPFYVYKMTPWDICKQMEYRHPSTIFKPMIYEERMTPFFGIKEQMYIARDFSILAQKKAAERLNENNKRYFFRNSEKKNIVKKVNDPVINDYYARRTERFEPVSNMHFASSSTNLISNQMVLNNTFSTVTNVNYFTSDSVDDFSQHWKWSSVEMMFDDNLAPWEIRAKDLKMSGTFGKYTAFCYGTTDLKKETEKMYSGRIFITGNAKIKAGDYIYLDDFDNRISGLVLVRECMHHFNSRGFVTEITPGLYVEPTQFMYNSLWLQLMSSMKLGATKTRISLSTQYNNEFEYVKSLITILDRYNKLYDKDQLSHQTPVELYGLYAGAGALLAASYFFLSPLLSTTGTPRLPLANLSKFLSVTTATLFTGVDAQMQKRMSEKLNKNNWYGRGKTKLGNLKDSTKAKILGSSTYQYMNKYGSKALQFANQSKLFRGVSATTTGIVKTTSTAAKWSLLRAGGAALMGVATTNPIGLVLDVVMTMAISWAYAAVEKEQYTRQPLLIFPVIRHGKPYQAGVTGAIRNSYIESLKTEFDKTVKQLKKTATILSRSREVEGKQPNILLRPLVAQDATALKMENSGE